MKLVSENRFSGKTYFKQFVPEFLPGAPQSAGSSSRLSGKRLLPAPASSSCGMTTFLLDRDLEPFFRDDVERLLGEEDDPSSSVRSPPGLTPSENITCKVAT